MKRRVRHPEHFEELNIVPYLDIMVNLVMFMLMSMTGFVTFQMINVVAPDTADAAEISDPSEPPPKKDEEPFVLNVSIAKNGFFIAATGGVLPGEKPAEVKTATAEPDKAEPTIPLTPEGEHDYAALTRKMVQIKAVYSDKSQVFIAAEPKVRYDVIVQTMDATRGTHDNLLFPDVAFAAF